MLKLKTVLNYTFTISISKLSWLADCRNGIIMRKITPHFSFPLNSQSFLYIKIYTLINTLIKFLRFKCYAVTSRPRDGHGQEHPLTVAQKYPISHFQRTSHNAAFVSLAVNYRGRLKLYLAIQVFKYFLSFCKGSYSIHCTCFKITFSSFPHPFAYITFIYHFMHHLLFFKILTSSQSLKVFSFL